MDISILLVDDDKLVVEKLEESIGWKELGIGMVFTAFNIRQAKKILEEYPVDIMISDIEMPQGSGLELLEWVREREIQVECLFLSSYAYFAYAQKALMLSSLEYILKPVSHRELECALQKAVGLIREKRNKEDYFTRGGYSPYAVFWENYLQQNAFAQEQIEKAISDGLYEEGECFCLELVRIFPDSEARRKKELKLYHFIINNVATEFFSDRGQKLEAVVQLSDYEWMLVFQAGNALASCSSDLAAYMKETLHLDVCIYVGKSMAFSQTGESRETLEEMEREAVPGEDGILLAEEWGEKERTEMAFPWEIWEKDMMNADDIRPTGDKILEAVGMLWRKTQATVPVFEQFRKEFMQMIYHYLSCQQIRITRIFDDQEFDEYYAAAPGTLGGMKQFVTYIFEKLAGYRCQDNRKESVVEQIRTYIDGHLREELSRKVLAQSVYLSEDYISKIFMSVTGMSIPNYVTEKRMERAREFLTYSALPVSKIALEVGYTNFSYFSKTFRDCTGCTPNEFRNRMQNRGRNTLKE